MRIEYFQDNRKYRYTDFIRQSRQFADQQTSVTSDKFKLPTAEYPTMQFILVTRSKILRVFTAHYDSYD